MGCALQYAATELRADPDVALVAVTSEAEALELVKKELRVDPDFALEAVKANCLVLGILAKHLLADRTWVLSAFEALTWQRYESSYDEGADEKLHFFYGGFQSGCDVTKKWCLQL